MNLSLQLYLKGYSGRAYILSDNENELTLAVPYIIKLNSCFMDGCIYIPYQEKVKKVFLQFFFESSLAITVTLL